MPSAQASAPAGARRPATPRPGAGALARAALGLVVLIGLLTGRAGRGQARAEATDGPVRVVSQTVGSDEMLLALADPGQVAALSHLSRDSSFCAVADEAATYPQIEQGDAEAILRFHPTLVLVADYTQPELLHQLRRAGVRLLVFTRYATLDDALENLRLLGRELGPAAEARAGAIAEDCRRRVRELQARLAGVRPIRVMAPSTYGLIPGAGTTFQDLCDHAGAENLAATLGGLRGQQAPPEEHMLAWPVEEMVLGGQSATSALAPFRSLPPYSGMPAIREGRAVVITPCLFSSVTFYRVNAYEALARALHPEIFR